MADVNRVGIAPDAAGDPMICYAGSRQSLSMLAGVPGAERWPEWDCLALPLSKQAVLLCETVGRIEASTPEYRQARRELLAAPMQHAARYPPSPAGEPEPMRHQIECFCHALECFENGVQGFGIWCEQGTGKSRLACDLMRALVEQSVLIVVQNSTSLQWRGWLERICPQFEVRMLTDIPVPKRMGLIQQPLTQPTAFVVNWEALARLQEPLKRLKLDLVIADEISRAKERNALMSKALSRVGATARYRIGMSGTPFGNNPGDLWALYRFLEPGVYGKSYWEFVNRFFLLGGFTGREFQSFNPLQIQAFISRMYSCAYRATKANLVDMPEKSFEVVELEMAGEQKSLYEQAARDMYAKRVREDGTVEKLSIPNALAQVTRLQQISAGLFPLDAEAGEEAVCRPIESVKTKWLCAYCKETLETNDSHLVIWCRFRMEIEAICQGLEEAGLLRLGDFAFIDGSVKMQDREAIRLAFNDRNCPLRILVCQIQAAAYGLDIPSADVLLYHTNSFSHLERSQSLERGHRLGRTRPYQIIDLVYKKSVDVKVLAALKRKQNLAEMLLVDEM